MVLEQMKRLVAQWLTAHDRTRLSRFTADQARALRAERVGLVASNAMTMALCNLAYCGMVAGSFWGHGADTPLALWLAIMLAVNGLAIVGQLRRDPTRAPSGSHRATRAIVRHAALMALLFSVAPFFLIPVAQGSEASILGGMTVGTLVIGPYVLHAIPRAALAWIAVCVTLNTLSYGMAGGPFAVCAFLGIVIGAGVARAALSQAARFTDQFADRLALREQADALARRSEDLHRQTVALDEQATELREKRDVIALLLKEYEEGSGAWLWECDPTGAVTRAPAPLLLLLPDRVRTERTFQAIVDGVPADDRHRIGMELSAILRGGRPFHDFLVPLTVGSGESGSLRWLSARGRPRFADDGALLGYRGIVADVTEAKLAEDRVRFLASHDALTELPNRITFAAHVRPWAAQKRRFASLHIDLDRFKLVNDTLGHVAGDELLVCVAERLRAACRAAHPDALAARVGGDEFMACVPLDDTEGDDAPARDLADAIVAALAEPFELKAGGVTIGASVGFAVWPDDGAFADLPTRVDLALYRAKESGRGQFQRYENGMDRRAQDRKKLEAELRGALARDEMHLAFQPIMDLENGRPAGLEALLRWTHPELGAVPPDSFIPLAEDSGLIVEIGSWVLREACREAAGWSKPLTIAVNVSPKQMLRDGFVEIVLGALAASGLPPERLELELTESILVEDPERALATIERLRRIGCRVVLDDFGTGYSSLSYLRTFVFDKIKVDRSFVSTLRETRSDGRPCSSTLVEAIVGMARTLGMRTTAEGIEEAWQADDLRAMGCDFGQGYHFSRPLPCAEIGHVTGGNQTVPGARSTSAAAVA